MSKCLECEIERLKRRIAELEEELAIANAYKYIPKPTINPWPSPYQPWTPSDWLMDGRWITTCYAEQ